MLGMPESTSVGSRKERKREETIERRGQLQGGRERARGSDVQISESGLNSDALSSVPTCRRAKRQLSSCSRTRRPPKRLALTQTLPGLASEVVYSPLPQLKQKYRTIAFPLAVFVSLKDLGEPFVILNCESWRGTSNARSPNSF